MTEDQLLPDADVRSEDLAEDLAEDHALPDDLAALVGERVHGLDRAGIVVLLEAGDDLHFAFPKTMTLARGQELVLTREILLASLDRRGNSLWAMDEDRQRLQYNGRPRFGFGPYPDAERALDMPEDLSNRYIISSTQIASYRGTDGSVRAVTPGVRPTW